MISRKVLLPVVLATAAGTPYLVMEDDWADRAKQQISGVFSGDGESEGSRGDAAAAGPGGGFNSEFAHGSRAEMPRNDIHPYLGGPPVQHLGEVVRFDISPDWVIGRWPRVTTTLAERGLEGLRVPLVTGTRPDDLAGSLTYYFDHSQQVQRLTFEGYTGDARRLLALVTQYYGLKPEPTLHAGMYLARWNGKPTSVCRISLAPIVTDASPRSQLRVLLELNRPSKTFGLSPETLTLLGIDQHAGRWRTEYAISCRLKRATRQGMLPPRECTCLRRRSPDPCVSIRVRIRVRIPGPPSADRSFCQSSAVEGVSQTACSRGSDKSSLYMIWL